MVRVGVPTPLERPVQRVDPLFFGHPAPIVLVIKGLLPLSELKMGPVL